MNGQEEEEIEGGNDILYTSTLCCFISSLSFSRRFDVSIVSMSAARRMAVFAKALLGADEKRKDDENDAAEEDCRRNRARLKIMKDEGQVGRQRSTVVSGSGGGWPLVSCVNCCCWVTVATVGRPLVMSIN